MIDVLTRLREIQEQSPEVAKAMTNVESFSSKPTEAVTKVTEAYIKNASDAVEVLANLRKIAKQAEISGKQLPAGYVNTLINDLYDVIVWIEGEVRGNKNFYEESTDKPVNEEVEIKLSGKDATLNQMLKLAGMMGAQVTDEPEMGMGMGAPDMGMGAPSMEPEMGMGMDAEPDMGMEPPMGGDSLDTDMDGDELDFSELDRAMDEEDTRDYSNSPDEEVLPFDTAVPAGSDMHRAKGTYPKTAGGDNPMAQPTVYRKA